MQHRAQVLSLKMVDSLPGILPPMQPRFRLLQSSQQLKAMLVRCHEVREPVLLRVFAPSLYTSPSEASTSKVKSADCYMHADI